MIAATDAEAVARGDYQIVLGEVHLANTLRVSAFSAQHPDRAQLVRFLEGDHTEPLVVPVSPKHRYAQRVNVGVCSARHFRYEFGTDPSPDPVTTLRVADLVVADGPAGLEVRTRDGR